MKNTNIELKDIELEKVNGGMKVVVEDEEPGLWETVMNFFFKIKS